MTPSRIRGLSVLALLLLDATVLLAWSQPWIAARADGRALDVPGSVAGGAELPLTLAGLALLAALLIAGPVFRVILAILQSLLGVCIFIAAALVLADPAAAATTAMAQRTGITGETGIVATPTAWPAVALVAGVLLAASGIVVAATVRLWPRPTSRFQRTRVGADDPRDEDPIREWDALSDGEDPTSPSR